MKVRFNFDFCLTLLKTNILRLFRQCNYVLLLLKYYLRNAWYFHSFSLKFTEYLILLLHLILVCGRIYVKFQTIFTEKLLELISCQNFCMEIYISYTFRVFFPSRTYFGLENLLQKLCNFPAFIYLFCKM